MKKNGKNEELQSRREFFKRAAKGLCLFWLVQLSCQVLSCKKLQMQCHAQDVTTVV